MRSAEPSVQLATTTRLPRGLQRLEMIGRGLEDIDVAAGAFRREIAALAAAGIDAGHAIPAPGTATDRAPD